MSKRSYRRIAVVAGAALAIGSMAPAMAARIDADAGAELEADPTMVISDVVNITDALPIPAVPALPALPTFTQVSGTIVTTGMLGNLLLGTTFGGLNTVVGTAVGGLGDLGGDCGLVAVASCNTASLVDASIPVNASGILEGGILNNTGDLGLGVFAPVAANVAAPVVATVGGLFGGGLPLGLLDGLLNVEADGSVNVLASVLGSL